MRGKFLLPLLVMIFANVWLFGDVWWNRSGTLTGEITFDDCHLIGPDSHYLHKEGRYFTLNIPSPPILDGKVMADTAGYGRGKQARTAYLLIEQGGPVFEEHRARLAEERKDWSGSGKVIGPNDLVFADSAAEVADLKTPDPDSTGHAIVKGYVRLHENGQGKEYFFRELARSSIAIHSDYRDIFKEIYARDKPAGVTYPSASPDSCTLEYRITLSFGARYEPWISRVERL